MVARVCIFVWKSKYGHGIYLKSTLLCCTLRIPIVSESERIHSYSVYCLVRNRQSIMSIFSEIMAFGSTRHTM